jgi:predicted nucleotidyltransferase
VGSTCTEHTVTIPAYIAEAVDRLVRAFDPTRVIRFGSRARGDAHPNSDVDLLVVMPEVVDTHATTIAMLAILEDLPMAKDVVVASEATIAQRGNAVGTIYRPALRDSVTLYQHARAEGEATMDPHDAPSHEDAERWLRHADEDLKTAEHCLGNEAIPAEASMLLRVTGGRECAEGSPRGAKPGRAPHPRLGFARRFRRPT